MQIVRQPLLELSRLIATNSLKRLMSLVIIFSTIPIPMPWLQQSVPATWVRYHAVPAIWIRWLPWVRYRAVPLALWPFAKGHTSKMNWRIVPKHSPNPRAKLRLASKIFWNLGSQILRYRLIMPIITQILRYEIVYKIMINGLLMAKIILGLFYTLLTDGVSKLLVKWLAALR